MSIQDLISQASKGLKKSFELYKDSKAALKELVKELKNELSQNQEFVENEAQIKILKQSRKEISETIRDLEKKNDQIAASLEAYQVAQDFQNTMEEKYSEGIDKELNFLAKELAEKGVTSELKYTNGQLSLIVAKHNY